MVTQYGMSNLGSINFDTSKKGGNSDLPEYTKMLIQLEIDKIISEARKIADEAVSTYFEVIKEVASEAKKKRTLNKHEIATIIRKHNHDVYLNSNYEPF